GQIFRFLKIVGVGFKARAESEGCLLYLKLGYSHEVELAVPRTVRVFCFKLTWFAALESTRTRSINLLLLFVVVSLPKCTKAKASCTLMKL
ncbi:60S ribosomal protein l6 mitochondrial, partial [Phtheirospermum japonicum]